MSATVTPPAPPPAPAPTNAAVVADPTAELVNVVKGLSDKVGALAADQAAITRKLATLSDPADPEARHAPFLRSGENALTSRGFSYLKAMGLLAGQVDPKDAKVEADVAARLKAHYERNGHTRALSNSIFMPVWGAAITGDDALGHEVKECVRAGTGPFDRDELAFVRRKMAGMGYAKALSWIDETTGGALVAPPLMGELIDLLRNNEVLMAAGARTLPMPPQGRLVVPRQTSAMTAYHVGESQNITDSTPGTGDVVLQAKKLTILAKIPNELFHFASIPVEAFVREDMVKVIALKMDKTLLEDVGSQTTPKGLINYAGINGYTSVGTAADANSGYALDPKDPYNVIAVTEEQNAQFRAFIMRPLLWAAIVNERADAVTAGDKKGPFMFNVWRDHAEDMDVERLKVGHLAGYPVFKSTQISKTRTRGSGSAVNTYVLGGNFQDYLLAMSGAIEFQISTQGDTPFTADQTWLKGVSYYDGLPRHEASFTLMDNVLITF